VKTLRQAAVLGIALLLAASTSAQQPAAQPGSIEFEARITPTGGRAEPLRKLPVWLLTKSFAELRKEAEKAEPHPDLDKFIDSLEVSPQLKAWMKRTRWVQLSGGEFMQRLHSDDIFEVPEFFAAYLARNAGDTTVGFPASRARDADRTRNPQRYEREQKAYRDAIRKFLAAYPHTMEGIEVELAPIDPSQRWARQESERRNRVRHRALEMAETTCMLAKAETDLEGRAGFVNVSPGDYWLSTLESEGAVGDLRLRWDVPVPVRAGRVTRLVLSNVNAVPKEAPPK
jgi:hypothetical protein